MPDDFADRPKRDRFMVTMQAIDDASTTVAALGAWLRLHCFCAARFNGGRIRGGKKWSNLDWAMHCKLKRSAVEEAVDGKMAFWDGDDLCLRGYDLKGEALYPAQSEGGKKGADIRWAKVRAEREAEAKRLLDEKATGSPNGLPIALPMADPAIDPHAHSRGGGKAEQGDSSPVVSSRIVAHASAQAVAAGYQTADSPKTSSTSGLASTWAEKNRQILASTIAGFEDPRARTIDVLRFFRVKFEVQGEALEGEWQRETKGQPPAEVALVFMHGAADGAIKLPSHYREARKRYLGDDGRAAASAR